MATTSIFCGKCITKHRCGSDVTPDNCGAEKLAIDGLKAQMNENHWRLYDVAIKEGYKDEVCIECGTVLLAFHHFVRCDSDTCPMKSRDSKGKASSLAEIILGDPLVSKA